MLKALELVGFKSFADKTRFEFSRGITAVVGPNGSGKSNVVDAIKWVLGEQSVKSLRGKEMVDVIFNGSGSRSALNTAETTLIIDNRQRLLPLDTPEVQITRRVYRSGEGEYLINRQPSRLRDIRELFAGTGVSAEAYSIIEQGKVDVMLQSSPKDRRLIFEEAAGISRFKAKKVESLRRLERVEQNLLRLSDIVSEVESRLRSVRMQASKARRYKEHVDRLQQVRTQVGLADWQKLSARLDGLEKELQSLGADFAARTAEADAAEAECGQLDAALAGLDDSLRSGESQLALNRQRIAACEATINHETARGRGLDDEVARQRGQLNALGLRARRLAPSIAATRYKRWPRPRPRTSSCNAGWSPTMQTWRTTPGASTCCEPRPNNCGPSKSGCCARLPRWTTRSPPSNRRSWQRQRRESGPKNAWLNCLRPKRGCVTSANNWPASRRNRNKPSPRTSRRSTLSKSGWPTIAGTMRPARPN